MKRAKLLKEIDKITVFKLNGKKHATVLDGRHDNKVYNMTSVELLFALKDCAAYIKELEKLKP